MSALDVLRFNEDSRAGVGFPPTRNGLNGAESAAPAQVAVGTSRIPLTNLTDTGVPLGLSYAGGPPSLISDHRWTSELCRLLDGLTALSLSNLVESL